MAAQKAGENAVAAVKAAFADLRSQLTRHKELLRGNWTRQSHRAARDRAIERTMELPELPPLEEIASRQGAPAGSAPQGKPARPAKSNGAAPGSIENWLSANLGKLDEFVDRELEFQVESERIRQDQITREEVIDEVIVSALSREDGSSHLLSLESWFHRLALQAIRRLITANADTASVSLDAPAGTQNVTGSDENVLQYHQPDESMGGASVLRDYSARTPEEIFASDEMVAQLDLLLHEVQAQDREAFVLYTLEGFTVEEISRLAGRPADHVRHSIHHARSLIQQKLPAQNELRQTLLQHSRVA
jgi:RNA polymerase sigma factor (sigma-70 family)